MGFVLYICIYIYMYWVYIYWVKCLKIKCSTEIKKICPPIKSFNRITWLSQRSHPLVLDAASDAPTSFFNPARVQPAFIAKLTAVVFPTASDRSMFKSNVRKYYSLFSPLSTYKLSWFPPCQHQWGHSLNGWKKKDFGFVSRRRFTRTLYVFFE